MINAGNDFDIVARIYYQYFQHSTKSTLILIPWTDFNIIERETRKCLDKG